MLKKILSNKELILGTSILLFFTVLWLMIGLHHFSLNADISRDLGQISELWIKKIVWLGPQLRVGFPISPLYFFLFLPGVFISGGSAYSLVFTQVTIALVAFSLLLFTDSKQLITEKYLGIFFIGLSSWWVTSTIKPWNGNQYVLWLLLALASAWTKKRLWLSLLFFGIAVAIHPAALLVAPIFLYELCKFKLAIWKKVVLFVGTMAGPWLPIFAFEFITKGYLTRQWLANKDTGMSISLGFENFFGLVLQSGLPLLLFILIISYSIFKSKDRARKWYLLLLPTGFFLFLLSSLHAYYMLGLVAALFFLVTKTIPQYFWGKILLGICIAFFSFQLFKTYSPTIFNPQPNRYQKMVSLVNELKSNDALSSDKTYALISIIDDQNSTPQADDYRFVFRTNGLQALSIDQYPQADSLVIFFENDQENPEQWSDWHSDHFGEKELDSSKRYNEFQVVIYKR